MGHRPLGSGTLIAGITLTAALAFPAVALAAPSGLGPAARPLPAATVAARDSSASPDADVPPTLAAASEAAPVAGALRSLTPAVAPPPSALEPPSAGTGASAGPPRSGLLRLPTTRPTTAALGRLPVSSSPVPSSPEVAGPGRDRSPAPAVAGDVAGNDVVAGTAGFGPGGSSPPLQARLSGSRPAPVGAISGLVAVAHDLGRNPLPDSTRLSIPLFFVLLAAVFLATQMQIGARPDSKLADAPVSRDERGVSFE